LADQPFEQNVYSGFQPPPEEKQKIFLPLLLFVITLLTTILSGIEWIGMNTLEMKMSQIVIGFPYSFSILFFLLCHEFGHFFASKAHGVKTTLPFFIPMTSLGGALLNFGTMGAVIRMRGVIPSRKALMDIGAAGPIAGFIVCVLLLIYGFTHLPGVEYILSIHPDYFSPTYGKSGIHLEFGSSIAYKLLEMVFTQQGQFVPPMSEIYHYPFLCAGWFGLFVTAMNLIPVGQLDGGHIVYALLGEKKHYMISSLAMIFLFVSGVLGVLQSFVWNWLWYGWTGWLVWSVVLYFVVKMKHPPVFDSEPLDRRRKITGYISIAIFTLCFMPMPIIITA
jgi:membrane-associated protease RseP (regulator of RpoE activity)